MKDGIGLTLFIMIFGWCSLYVLGFMNLYTTQQAVSTTVYQYTQIAGKKGSLNSTIYNDLKTKMDKIGNYRISIKAEKYNRDGSKENIVNDLVIDTDLRELGYDVLTIYVESNHNHWLSKLCQLNFIGGSFDYEYKIATASAVYIQ